MFNERPTMLQRMVSALFCFKIFIVEQLDLTFFVLFWNEGGGYGVL